MRPVRCLRYGVSLLGLWLLAPLASSAELPGLASAARSILGPRQGVYVETADGTVLLEQAADVPVHPASVSKVPTTLALLRKLGPEHRFTTTFSATGRIRDGTLYGDLWVQSEGDPSLVDEDALLVAARLNEMGVRRVIGDLRSRGSLTFDWQSEADATGLRRALSGETPLAAWEAVRALQTSDTAGAAQPRPGIQFVSATVPTAGSRTAEAEQLEERPLIVHKSQPLLSLVKALNDYSNNIFTPFAAMAGGAAAVETVARSCVPASMRSEITLGDGAGMDPTNRLSPRAAVQLLRALERDLQASGHALYDVLPVAGVDEGTLRDRLNAPDEAGRVVGKTGTFGSYGASALIGAVSTSDRGTVYFAILNHDVPVPRARRCQDKFVHALLMRLHSTPWNYQPDRRPGVARTEVAIALK